MMFLLNVALLSVFSSFFFYDTKDVDQLTWQSVQAGALLMSDTDTFGLRITPNGPVGTIIKNDTTNGDFPIIDFCGKNDSLYYVLVLMPWSGKAHKGWMPKGACNLGIYLEYPSPPHDIPLYLEPKKKTVCFRIKEEDFTSDLYKVIDFAEGGWLKIEFYHNGRRIRGWVEEQNQSCNPY